MVLLKKGCNVVQPLRLGDTQQLRRGRCCCHRRGILRSYACCRQMLLGLLQLVRGVVLVVLAGGVLPVWARRGGGGRAHAANRARQLVVQV